MQSLVILFVAFVSVLGQKPDEHKLVDICGVRDLLEANCNGASNIDSCDKCVHEAVKVGCPALDPPDCGKLNTCINDMKFDECSDEDEREQQEQDELEAQLQLEQEKQEQIQIEEKLREQETKKQQQQYEEDIYNFQKTRGEDASNQTSELPSN